MTDFARAICYASGMEIIYIDSLFFLNLLLDYLLLLTAGRLCSLPLIRPRIALGAAFGALYAVFAVLEGKFLISAPIKLLSGIICAAAAYGFGKQTARAVIAFFGVSAAFGGAVYALSRLSGGSGGGRLFIPVSTPILVLSFALCYAAVSLVFRYSASRPAGRLCRVRIILGEREACFTALRDSGNELVDPLSGREVMVVELSALSRLFPEVSPGSADVPQLFMRLSEAGYRPRLVFCRSVGARSTPLVCITPDEVWAAGERLPLAVALSTFPLSPDGGYQAVANLGRVCSGKYFKVR